VAVLGLGGGSIPPIILDMFVFTRH